MAEAVPGIAVCTDAAGIITFANRRGRDFAGATLYGTRWADLLHPDDRAAWQAALAAAALWEDECRLRRHDGVLRWQHCRAVPQQHAAAVDWCVTAVEIEDRRQAEAALADNEKRLRLAVEAGSLATFEVELDTRKRHWTPRMAALFGLAPETVEVDAARIPDFTHPDDLDLVIRHFEDAVRSGHLDEIEFRVITLTGETRWLASNGLVLGGGDRPGRMIGAIRDVTERRLREEALREALAARELLVREADHRIKNSLQLVVGLLTLQQRRLSDPEASAALASAAARVEAVAQSHLALQQSADLKTVDLGHTLRELCARLATLSAAVRPVCAFDGPLVMDAERAIPLALIVSELLTNALRHAFPAGAGAVTVDVATAANSMVVSVTDTGVGFDPARAAPGLGSTVVQTLARQIDAEVVTTSSPGSGTRTTVTLARQG
jgi:PAS domain S-box-containing protein